MKKILFVFSFLFLLIACKRTTYKDYPIQGVLFTDVTINDNFWSPRVETNRIITIPHDFSKCEVTGRIDNFLIVNKKKKGQLTSNGFDDSDVYKIIEGAAYSLATHHDEKLEKYVDSIIDVIISAQDADGYLYTHKSDTVPHWQKERINSHETYNLGHMYEAAVAYFQATGKRVLLDASIKSADLLYNTFGPGRIDTIVSGHQEIEIGLIKLYRITQEQKYLQLAKLFLDRRGKSTYRYKAINYWDAPRNHQDDKSILEQDEAYGHAVRATYMYSAITDVAALTGDTSYTNIVDRIWKNVTNTKIYITGGIGSEPRGEEYGKNYLLPNDTAYNETCAAIANVFWNQRMFLLHGESKYIDVLERTLYNGLISGYSFDGTEFFYPNPLEFDGKRKFNKGASGRQKWFGCSCCPTNIARFISSLSGYIYAVKKDTVYVNLFIGSKGKIKVDDHLFNIEQVTEYPWKGDIQIHIDPEKETEASVAVRIPCWALNQPMPGSLYSFSEKMELSFNLTVNSRTAKYEIHNGYAFITGKWKKGDCIALELQMPIRKVVADEKVKADSNRFCLSRGPLVYCAEGVDNNGSSLNLLLSLNGNFKPDYRNDLLNGIWGISGEAFTTDKSKPVTFRAIPYFAWAYRGCSEMEVWFREK